MLDKKDDFKIKIESIISRKNLDSLENNLVISISSIFLGTGDCDLGIILLLEFIEVLKDYEPMPKTIILCNEAVKLAAVDSTVYKSLVYLETKGVKILICSSSVAFYDISSKIKIGTMTDMYNIIDEQVNASKLITI